MKSFKPADNYETLKRQAYAMANLIHSLEDQVVHYSKENDMLKKQLLLVDRKAIEALRSENELLTNLIAD